MERGERGWTGIAFIQLIKRIDVVDSGTLGKAGIKAIPGMIPRVRKVTLSISLPWRNSLNNRVSDWRCRKILRNLRCRKTVIRLWKSAISPVILGLCGDMVAKE
jgi:hypothetical protein